MYSLTRALLNPTLISYTVYISPGHEHYISYSMCKFIVSTTPWKSRITIECLHWKINHNHRWCSLWWNEVSAISERRFPETLGNKNVWGCMNEHNVIISQVTGTHAILSPKGPFFVNVEMAATLSLFQLSFQCLLLCNIRRTSTSLYHVSDHFHSPPKKQQMSNTKFHQSAWI